MKSVIIQRKQFTQCAKEIDFTNLSEQSPDFLQIKFSDFVQIIYCLLYTSSRLQDKIFRNPNMADPYKHSAGTRDGAMSCLIGIAARKSIEDERPVKIEELTDIKPHPARGV